jgi:hypothetical protein
MTIPTSFTLPFGWTVKVVWLDDEDFNEEFDTTTKAGWYNLTKTIYLRESRRGKPCQIEDFAHEVLHVIVDWSDRLNWHH